jgi:hypothetical protein
MSQLKLSFYKLRNYSSSLCFRVKSYISTSDGFVCEIDWHHQTSCIFYDSKTYGLPSTVILKPDFLEDWIEFAPSWLSKDTFHAKVLNDWYIKNK